MDRNRLVVQLDDGSTSTLAELNKGKPFILVFLRHYGCIFCRYQVAQLRPATDLPIFFVGMGSVGETSAFKARSRSPHRFIADPERKLYERFGVSRADLTQMINLRTVGQGLRATLAGQFQGRAKGDPLQLGASFILDGKGDIVWSRFAQDAAEIVDAVTLRDQLSRVGQLEPATLREDDPGRNHPSAGD